MSLVNIARALFATLTGRPGSKPSAQFHACINQASLSLTPFTLAFILIVTALALPNIALAQSQPQPNRSGKYSILLELANNQLILARQIATSDTDPSLIPPLEMLAATHATIGNFKKSASYYKQSAKIQEAAIAANPNTSVSDIIFTYNKLGILLQEHGQVHEAEPYLKRALQMRVRASGPQRVTLPDLLNNLAAVYQALGRFAEAEPLYQRALDTLKADNRPLRVALGLNNLGEINVSMDRFKKAEQYHLRALEIRRAIAPGGIEFGLSLNNLGSVYKYQERYKEAETLFLQTLEVWQRHYGARHPYVAIALNNLATVYMEQKRYDEAETLNRRVLDIRKAMLGPEHPEVAATLSNIAKVYINQEKYTLAEPFARRSLAINEKTQKPGHPYIRKGLKRLIKVYNKTGKQQLAAPLQARLAAMPPPGMKHLPVFYATNRAQIERGSKASYGTKPADSLQFGRATILIPDTLIKRQGLRRAKAAGLLDRGTGKLTAAAELKLLRLAPQKNFADLAAQAIQTMKLAGTFKNQMLVVIHGYNASFDDALLRAAQITFDLEFDGVLVPFSWPSQGTLSGYSQDEKSAAAAADKLIVLLQKLAIHMRGKKLHIIAHSMGNRVLLRALERLSKSDANWQSVFGKLELGEIIWAHPDVDQKAFANLTKRFAARGAAMTLYSTRDDWALWASKLLHGVKRAGSELVLVRGVDTIDITGMKAADIGWFGFDLNHNVFVRNPALFGEITRLMLTGRRPVDLRSPAFRKASRGGKPYWRYQP